MFETFNLVAPFTHHSPYAHCGTLLHSRRRAGQTRSKYALSIWFHSNLNTVTEAFHPGKSEIWKEWVFGYKNISGSLKKTESIDLSYLKTFLTSQAIHVHIIKVVSKLYTASYNKL